MTPPVGSPEYHMMILRGHAETGDPGALKEACEHIVKRAEAMGDVIEKMDYWLQTSRDSRKSCIRKTPAFYAVLESRSQLKAQE